MSKNLKIFLAAALPFLVAPDAISVAENDRVQYVDEPLLSNHVAFTGVLRYGDSVDDSRWLRRLHN